MPRSFIPASVALLFVALPVVAATDPKTSPPAARTVVVDVPLQTWLDGYLAWIDKAPFFAPHKGKDGYHLNVKMPFLGLYTSDGRPLYTRSDAKDNAAFLTQLEAHIPSAAVSVTSDPTPSLTQLMNLAAPLRAANLKLGRTTLFAVSFPDKPFCKVQNDALQHYESTASARTLQIIEVRLHSSRNE